MASGQRSNCTPPGGNPWDGSDTRRAHLVGIAGSGMRALADVMLAAGWTLSGSDLRIAPARELAPAGVRLREGHAAEYLPPGTGLVVHSDAVAAHNPELRRAAELGIPTLSYFRMVGRLTLGMRVLAVAGAHGKSTTTAMAGHVFTHAGRDPTVFCGAAPLGRSSGGRGGGGEVALVEACEYRANFLHLRPNQAVILGIEPDHFDCYGSPAELERAFARFARSVPEGGLLLARHDCQSTQRAVATARCRVESFGLQEAADWSAGRLSPLRGHYAFEIRRLGRSLCHVSLQVPGRHNVLNALAAAALGLAAGVPPDRIALALGSFSGLHRRMESLGTWRGVRLIDDYAHHPTEVAAALGTVRRMHPGRRVWCVFQPHQVSRTERLLDELAASLQNADVVLVADIFRARECPPHSGEVTAADLARRVRCGGVEVPRLHTIDQIARLLETRPPPGDVLITIGAGDIRRICDGFIKGIRGDRTAG